jgi:hypothetical protein
MIFRSIALALVAASILSGCASAPPAQRIAFNEAEFQRLPQTGTGVVEGQVFTKTLGGDVKYGAGEEVRLIPATSYGEQWWQVAVLEKKEMSAPDPRYINYIRTTQADGSGSFHFEDVPPGRYFVSSRVAWYAPTGFRGSLQLQGGYVANRLEIQNGKTARVVITQRP